MASCSSALQVACGAQLLVAERVLARKAALAVEHIRAYVQCEYCTSIFYVLESRGHYNTTTVVLDEAALTHFCADSLPPHNRHYSFKIGILHDREISLHSVGNVEKKTPSALLLRRVSEKIESKDTWADPCDCMGVCTSGHEFLPWLSSTCSAYRALENTHLAQHYSYTSFVFSLAGKPLALSAALVVARGAAQEHDRLSFAAIVKD